MPTRFIFGASNAAQSLFAAGDDIVVAPSGRLTVGATAISGLSGLHEAAIFGFVASAGASTIELSGGNNSIDIGPSAAVVATGITSTQGAIELAGGGVALANAGTVSSSGLGVVLSGDLQTILNSGSILGDAGGVDSTGSNVSFSNSGMVGGGTSFSGIGISVENSGGITSQSGGIGVAFLASDDVRLVNDGTISGATAIDISSEAGTVAKVFNHGTLDGETSFLSGAGDEKLVNTGVITGAVSMGGGDDIYNGRGSLVGVNVQAGAGNDTLIAGQGDDLLAGGTGNDTYYIYSEDTVFEEAVGEGQDKIFSMVSILTTAEIERVTLRGSDDIDCTSSSANVDNILLGNFGDNVLLGVSGNDSLAGRAGNDILNGGAGRDALTGNAGSDLYVYNSVTESGITGTTRDQINFDGFDRIDLSNIDANSMVVGNQAFTIIFGGVPVAGQMLISGAPGSYLLSMNIDADAALEMTIQVNAQPPLTAADFIL